MVHLFFRYELMYKVIVHKTISQFQFNTGNNTGKLTIYSIIKQHDLIYIKIAKIMKIK